MIAVDATHIAMPPRRDRLIGRIPVRNLWLLFLYASNLANFYGRFNADVEEATDFPSLIARLLCHAVENRLRRNLSRGYIKRQKILSRMRGRIDLLKTESQALLSRGLIGCRFEEHSFDTPRNRLVRAALTLVSSLLGDDDLVHRCRYLSNDLSRLGVGGLRPSRAEIATDRFGRHDSEDLLMVTLAKLVFDLRLPTEDSGSHPLSLADRDEKMVRKLFEKAIGNFLASELGYLPKWRVSQGKKQEWQIESPSVGLRNILPGMQTDIIVENQEAGRRIVIDTKFSGIFGRGQYREQMLKSGYIYQMYSYLRSQESSYDTLANSAEGMLLHPTIDDDVDESVIIQGHKIRFKTIDLGLPTADVLSRLKSISDDWSGMA